jgi:membrane-bound lytic murein transglycosylase
MIVTIQNLEAAAKEIQQHSDVDVTVEAHEFRAQGTPQTLAEFELVLAMELAKPTWFDAQNGITGLQPVRVRNYFTDLVDARSEAQGTTDEQVWIYRIAVSSEIGDREVIEL